MTPMRPQKDMLHWFDNLHHDDPFMDIVREHGQWFFGRANVADYEVAIAWEKKNKPKVGECFYNSRKFCADHRGPTYWEGYFLIRGLPMHHAWVVMEDGRVVDFALEDGLRVAKSAEFDMFDDSVPEYDDTVPLYFGVNVPRKFIMAHIVEGGRGGPIAGPLYGLEDEE